MIWHTGQKEDVLNELKTQRETGLTTQEAEKRQAEFGKNALREKPRRTFLQRFLNQMQDTMVIILLIATLISLAVCIYNGLRGSEAEWAEPIVIITIVILNAVMGVVQESRADAALEALKTMSAPNAKVWRDGVLTTVSGTELVPGDIVTFEAGDMVPADCRLLECTRLYCDESALTGESLPVEKDAKAEVASTMPLGDRINMVYSGCAVSNGNGTAVVVATGMSTEMGRIAAMLGNEEDTATPLQRKLAQLGKQLGFLALAICFVIFVIGVFSRKITVMEIFMTAVSLAVAAIPEGLLAIVTVVLAMGVQRMVKQKALIRRLPAVETLGSASVVCSDKTGTLTQNRMTLVRAFMGGHMEDLRQEPSEAALTLVRLATLCTDGTVQVTADGVEQHIGDPTETAIVAYALHNGIMKEDLFAQCPRVDEIPFDSERKLMTSVHFIDGETIAIVKGAPEILLSRCTQGDVEAALAANEAMGKSALRVLAVACRKLRKKDAHEEDVMENDLTLLGLLGMMDPPRTEAMAAIRECRAAGIRPIMITGDHVVTASAIATQMGILTEDTKAITGAELAEMSDKDLKKHITEYSVYARVTPADKIRIVKAWKKRGEVVAMTGDGVNDAPALKAADIGCAMGITGTDVAKGASDIVLLDDNFATIVAAVKEGRGIYDNIRKAVHFLLSCNLGEVLAVLFAMIFWRETPFAPMQLLWINLVTDSLPALALGMEPAEADIMTRKPRSRKESLFAGTVGQQAVWQGAMIAALSLFAYYVGSRVLPGASAVLGETMAFATMAFAQMVHAFNVRSSHSLFEVGFFSNRYMGGAFLASLASMLLVLLVPFMQTVFGVAAMSGTAWLICIALSVVPFIVTEAYKYFGERRQHAKETVAAAEEAVTVEDPLEIPAFVDADQVAQPEEVQQEFYVSEMDVPTETAVADTEEVAETEEE